MKDGFWQTLDYLRSVDGTGAETDYLFERSIKT